MERMPLLALRMRNALRPSEDATVEPKLESDRPWTWDDAQERLTAAFDKGGLGAWADAAAREVEEEAKLEMEKREELKKGGPRRTG